jgi:hypothetical protein
MAYKVSISTLNKGSLAFSQERQALAFIIYRLSEKLGSSISDFLEKSDF